jgi:hypothetical protein
MPTGVVVPDEVRERLEAMRMKHRLTFGEIGRLAGLSQEMVRRVIRLGCSVRDVNAQALVDLVGKYDRGEITFLDGKAVGTETIGSH